MPATRENTAKQDREGPPDTVPMPAGSEAAMAMPPDAAAGSGSTSTSRQTSSSSGEPSSGSKSAWHKPRTVREFAAQANQVATMILNGQIDMDVAKGYATLARVVAQSASIEVTRARFLKREPDLSLE